MFFSELTQYSGTYFGVVECEITEKLFTAIPDTAHEENRIWVSEISTKNSRIELWGSTATSIRRRTLNELSSPSTIGSERLMPSTKLWGVIKQRWSTIIRAEFGTVVTAWITNLWEERKNHKNINDSNSHSSVMRGVIVEYIQKRYNHYHRVRRRYRLWDGSTLRQAKMAPIHPSVEDRPADTLGCHVELRLL